MTLDMTLRQPWRDDMVEFPAIVENAGQEYRDAMEVEYCEDGLTVS